MTRSSRPALALVTAVVAGLLTAVAGAPAAESATAAPTTTPGAFVGLTPARVLDTRSGNGAPKTPAVSGRALHVTVAGRGGVPADAAAVVLTLTVVGTNAGGYLTAYPTGGAAPTASVVNWATGETISGSATVTVGSNGRIDLVVRAARGIDLVADVSGYLLGGSPTAPGAYVARTPTRLLDTRTGVGAPKARLGSNRSLQIPLAGRGGLPAAGRMSAVVGTLTAVRSAKSGYLTVWPDGNRPAVSSVNYLDGQVVANQVTVALGANGGFSVFAARGPVDVVFDVTGYVIGGQATATGTYVPVSPSRLYDTRRLPATPPPNSDFRARLVGRGSVPATGMTAVVANVTVTDNGRPGYLTAWPTGRTRPLASILNWTASRSVANQASLALGPDGNVDLRYTGIQPVSVIVDVSGFYVAPPPAAPTGLTAAVTTPGTPRQTVALRWTASTDAEQYLVRRADGTVAPTGPEAGRAVANVGTASATDVDVQPGSTYSYAVFARDGASTTSTTAALVTITTPALDPTPLDLGPATPIPLPSGVQDAFSFAQDVDCPATGACIGVGSLRLDDDTDGRLAFVLTQQGDAWSSTLAPLPGDAASDGFSELRAVDCTAAADCVAVGLYTTTADRIRPLVVRIQGDTLTAGTTTLADAATPSALAMTDVDCPAAGTCLGVGSYATTASGTVPLALVVDTAGTRVAPRTVGAGITAARPTTLSCVSTANCAAVGAWGNEAGTTSNGLTGRWDGTRWTWSDAPRPADTTAGSMRLLGVACPADGACTATGSAKTAGNREIALRSTSTGGAWQTVTLPPIGSTTFGGYVECRTGGRCVSVYRTLNAATVVGPAAGATTGVSVPVPTGVDAGKISPFDLACDTDLRCALPGAWVARAGDGNTRAMVTAVVDGTATTYQVGPVVPGSTDRVVAARAGCAPDGSCVVTGWSDTPDGTRGFLQTFSLAGV